MPFDDSSFNPEDEQNQGNQIGQSAQGGQNSTVPSGGVIAAGAPGGVSGAPSNSGAPTSSGSFTNLQAYLDANQGANFGSQLAGKVQGQIDQAGQGQNAANQQFTNDVNAATTNWNPNAMNQALTDAGQGSVTGQDVTNFQQALNANNNWNPNLSSIQTDPNANFNQVADQTQNALQSANATKTDGGQFALLNQFFNTPNYTQGEKNLDQYLIGADPNAQQAFQGVQQNAQNLNSNWNNQLSADSGLASNAQQTNAQTAQQANADLYGQGGNYANATGGAYGNLNSQLQSQLKNNQSNDSNLSNAWQTYLSNVNNNNQAGTLSGNIDSSNPASALGLNPTQLHQLETAQIQAADLYTQGRLPSFQNGLLPTLSYTAPQNETAAGAANANQQAQLAALGQLSGNPYTAPAQNYSPGQVAFDPQKWVSYLQSQFPNANQYPAGDPNSPMHMGSYLLNQWLAPFQNGSGS